MAGETVLLYFNIRDHSTQVYAFNGNRREGLSQANRRIGAFVWHETHWMRARNKLYGIVFYEPLTYHIREHMGAPQTDLAEKASGIERDRRRHMVGR